MGLWLSIRFIIIYVFLSGVEAGFKDAQVVEFQGIRGNYVMHMDITDILRQAQRQDRPVKMAFYANTVFGFEVTKCDSVLISTWTEMQSRTMEFYGRYVDLLIEHSTKKCNGTEDTPRGGAPILFRICSFYRLELVLYSNRKRMSKGKFIFSLGFRQRATIHDSFLGPFVVESKSSVRLVYNAKIADNLTEESSGMSIFVITDVSSPVKISFGKCSMILQERLTPSEKDTTLLSPELVKKIRSLTTLTCSEDPKNENFEIHITTTGPTTGKIFLSVEPTRNVFQRFSLLFILFAVFGVLALAMCWKNCRVEEPVRFGTPGAARHYRENYLVPSLAGPHACESCGNAPDAHIVDCCCCF
ncbi:Protein CBG25746 [Caenorhabditis briggsae]|uniref:Protein CBG25746 n=1 Tax=Caenorhabditis briggsae TaxID=6238 RepID=B6IHR7_CAEBR|nr:Protein CBG25746 [Caenorhabditis briggsae]CAR99447.1 Protein CBG25746 [Caenorhabditis briggsae]